MNRSDKLIPLAIALVVGLAVGFTFAAVALRAGSAPKAAVDDGSEADHAAMQRTLDGMTTALKDKTGESFDREFLAQMIAHHEGAVAMARLALKSSEHSEIRTLAEKIITMQNEEIAQMKEWQSAWF